MTRPGASRPSPALRAPARSSASASPAASNAATASTTSRPTWSAESGAVGSSPRYAEEVASESEPEGAARSMASRSPAPSTMLLMVPLPREAGEDPHGSGGSAHRRHDVFGAGADAGRPARGHRLQPRVEAHALAAVDGHVAEQRALPAAKAVERHRHRDRHVDADHADLHAAGEFARGIAVTREDRDAVAVFVVARELGRLVERIRAHDRQYRAEDLLLVDAHLGLDVVEHRAADKEAVLVA